ncbi:MAG: hypothetical protein H0T39_04970 [Actinobacteria bacterium]|nr:hypothetical protein [Actinomycetota bacterium]
MKKRLLLGPGLVLAVLVSLLGAQAIAAGGGSDTLAISPIGQELEGTWLTRVEPQNPPPGLPASFPALNTYLPSGELVETGVGMSPSRRSPGHGEWVRTGDRRFALTLVFFRFDAEGRYIGTQEAHTQLRLRRNLRHFRGVSVAIARDPQGNILGRFNATVTGARIEVQVPAEGDSAAEGSAESDE